MNTDFADVWSLAHVSSGILIFHFLLGIFGKRHWWFAAIAVALAAGWELLEDNDWVQSQFRKYGFPDYYGDTKRNMVADQLFSLFGFIIAWYGPQWFVLLPMLSEVLMYLVSGTNTLLTFVRFFK